MTLKLVKAPTKSEARKLRLRRRRSLARHDEYARTRVSLERRLERHVGPNVRVQVYRMTIGERFNHARNNEVILNLRGFDPLLVPVVAVDSLLSRRKGQMDASAVYEAMEPAAKKWAKQRKPVKRPGWRPRSK